MRKIIFVPFLLILFSANTLAEDWLYSVRPGETLAGICQEYVKEEGCWRKLIKHNAEIPEDGKLTPGLRIKIPVEWLHNSPIAVVAEYVLGDVFVQRKRTSATNKLQAGMLLLMGDSVSTASNGKVLLRFADNSSLLLKPQTEIMLNRLSVHGASGMVDTDVRLNRGAGHFSIESQKHKTRYRISTPSAIAAVRGTKFRITSDPHAGDIMRNEVLEGAVQVSAAGEDKDVEKGYGTLAEQGKKPIPPIELLPAPTFDLPEAINVPQTLHWQAVAGAKSYVIDIFEGDSKERLLFSAATEAPEYLLNAMADGRYTLAVRGVDKLGLQGLNDIKHVSATKVFRAPELNATSVTRNGESLDINWPEIDGAFAYQLDVSTSINFSETIYSEQLSGNSVSIEQPKGKY
ncbi:MAG: FecR domain-containing protein, partial [Pseudomonadales bacterium]